MNSGASETLRAAGEVRSAARALDILELLGAETAPITLTSIAGAIGVPKSSTLMLLRTLTARGYVVRDAVERYTINDAFARRGFGWGGENPDRIAAIALPIMEELRGRVPETYILGALVGFNRVKVLAKVVSPQELRYDADVVALRPAYCTAMGRALLAYSDAETRDAALSQSDLAQVTPATVTDAKHLRTILDRVRLLGHAVVEEEYVLGASGAAAPIFGKSGRIVAALDVASVTARFHDVRTSVIESAVEGARRISALLGGKAPLAKVEGMEVQR
jgi:DNA-binding IclR family transcriptional regulator